MRGLAVCHAGGCTRPLHAPFSTYRASPSHACVSHLRAAEHRQLNKLSHPAGIRHSHATVATCAAAPGASSSSRSPCDPSASGNGNDSSSLGGSSTTTTATTSTSMSGSHSSSHSSSSSSSTSAAAVATVQYTCRRCLARFEATSNTRASCRHHPSLYSGGEVAKAIGFVRRSGAAEDQLGAVVGRTGLLRFWDCCGAEAEDAPGCTASYHVTFDDQINQDHGWD